MATLFGSGVSENKNTEAAVKEAILQAKEKSGIKKVDFAFVFATVGHIQEHLMKCISDGIDGAPFVGCSGVGVIGHQFSNEENFAISIMLASSEEIKFHSKCFENLTGNDEKIGNEVAKWIEETNPEAKSLFVFPEGLSCNFDAFTRGYETQAKNILPTFGGLAGDNFLMKQTYQYCNGKAYSNAMVVATLSGDFEMAWGVTHGCIPLGEVRTITKADQNIIYEIDDKPVLEVLKEYLSDEDIDNWNRTVANICLGFKAAEDIKDNYDEYIIRFMPAKNDANGSVVIPSEVKAGDQVWMTRRDQECIENGVTKMISEIKTELKGQKPLAVLHIDCAGRGKMVMSTGKKEAILNQFQSEIQSDTAWGGFYSFGEMAPVKHKNYFHNYTAVVLAFYQSCK